MYTSKIPDASFYFLDILIVLIPNIFSRFFIIRGPKGGDAQLTASFLSPKALNWTLPKLWMQQSSLWEEWIIPGLLMDFRGMPSSHLRDVWKRRDLWRTIRHPADLRLNWTSAFMLRKEGAEIHTIFFSPMASWAMRMWPPTRLLSTMKNTGFARDWFLFSFLLHRLLAINQGKCMRWRDKKRKVNQNGSLRNILLNPYHSRLKIMGITGFDSVKIMLHGMWFFSHRKQI